MTLVATGRTEIGLYPDVLFPGFGTGATLATFHSLGNLPVEIDKLIRVESGKAILIAVLFNIFADIPSLPDDLVVSRVDNSSNTESSIDNNSTEQSTAGNSSWNMRIFVLLQ